MTNQTSFWNGELDESKLGNYAYALVDPRTQAIFYVGVAGGLEDKGNDRPTHHLAETRDKLSSGEELSAKQQHIADIWRAGMQVELMVLRRLLRDGLSGRDVAFQIEATVMDLLNNVHALPELKNDSQGHGNDEHGIVTAKNRHEVLSVPVAPIHVYPRVFLFNIANQADKRQGLYEAVRGYWSISENHTKEFPALAVGLVRGISRIVVNIARWERVMRDGKKKMAFDGETVANSSDYGFELLNKSYKTLIRKPGTEKTYGNFLRGGVLGVEFPGERKARFFRGVADKRIVTLSDSV